MCAQESLPGTFGCRRSFEAGFSDGSMREVAADPEGLPPCLLATSWPADRCTLAVLIGSLGRLGACLSVCLVDDVKDLALALRMETPSCVDDSSLASLVAPWESRKAFSFLCTMTF